MSCIICLDQVSEQQVVLPCCKNIIHQECFVRYLISAPNILCPLCRFSHESIECILSKGKFIDSIDEILKNENIPKEYLQRANDILNHCTVKGKNETVFVVDYLEVENNTTEFGSPYGFLRNTYVQVLFFIVWMVFILGASLMTIHH